MTAIKIYNKERWFIGENIWATGHAWAEGRLLVGKSWQTFFEPCNTFKQFEQKINRCNGFFALILKRGDKILAAVDRIRSIPLFYTRNGAIITDNALLASESLPTEKWDAGAIREFFAVGHVSGPRTLRKEIAPVEAGEILEIANGKPHKKSYFEYLHTTVPEDISVEERHRRFKELLRETFERLVVWAAGRTLVLPLSGGYDSRLLAYMAREMDIKDLICFTYGRPDFYDAVTARRIAGYLGLPIHFVNSYHTPHRRIYNSPLRARLDEQAFNLISLPNIQDLPALYRLKQEGRIPDDAILISGHSGDFVSGRHLDNLKPDSDTLNTEQVIDNIIRLQYSIYKPAGKELMEMRRHLRSLLPVNTADRGTMYEHWVWRERQAKFLVNAMRTFDVLGHEWHLPLWDNAFVDFFLELPKELRKGQKFYREHINAMHPHLDYPPNKITKHGWVRDIRFRRYGPGDWLGSLKLMWLFGDMELPNRRFIHKLNLVRYSHLLKHEYQTG
ncbi:MAG TPA: asparagine synthetase B family protein [Caldithrix abyssi]|uniref:asparagine synthase (glutamine-hydrolyzing) n=1 Tax=Caldithrix abyssi TaxID=187145 RepID=A0A7V1LNN8_CALAY|nr:asparagine synthetase B family protein [Caldithrix abyssi]